MHEFADQHSEFYNPPDDGLCFWCALDYQLNPEQELGKLMRASALKMRVLADIESNQEEYSSFFK